MAKGLKREPLTAIHGNTPLPQTTFRSVKGDNNNPIPDALPGKRRRSARTTADRVEDPAEPAQGQAERRVLRSQYLAVQTAINEEKEELCKGDSVRLQNMIRQVDDLYEHVQKPREQVADAETLLDIANTLVTTVKSHSKEGVTPSDFVTCLIHEFGTSIKWKDIGVLVSPVFKRAHGCATMMGPMDTELKQRKVVAHRKRGRQTESAARPEQLNNTKEEEKTDTDQNMGTMFDILRKKRSVRVENLILNRSSFAQTVENLFALSFLVKDGRAEISVDDRGNHIVAPRNAPQSNLVASGEVMYNHFVFRFDYKDWKLVKEAVGDEDGLMPQRYQVNTPIPI